MKARILAILCAGVSLFLFVVFRNGAVGQINYDDDHYSTVYLNHFFTLARSLELAAAILLIVVAVLLYDKTFRIKRSS